MSEETKKLRYVCGMHKSSAKKMCRFIFQEFFYKININLEQRTFEVLVFENITDEEGVETSFKGRFGEEYINYFREFWGGTPGFNIRFYKGIMIEDFED